MVMNAGSLSAMLIGGGKFLYWTGDIVILKAPGKPIEKLLACCCDSQSLFG
jgi:hypothetical protein